MFIGVCLVPGVPGGDPPPRTATAAGGTHPTGMHSCCKIISMYLVYFLQIYKKLGEVLGLTQNYPAEPYPCVVMFPWL